MKLMLVHGRLDPNTGGTDLDGNEVDDWGFEGPTIAGIKSIGGTYGEVCVHFHSERGYEKAKHATGWDDCVHEQGLLFDSLPDKDADCVSIFNPTRGRREYFGDWGLA